METSPLFNMFMAPANVQKIQAAVIQGVKQQLNIVIGPQDENSLKVLMHTSYVNLSRDPTTNIGTQVDTLNADTVRLVLKDIIPRLQMNRYYLSKLGTMPAPLQLPVNVSNAGKRMNEQNIGLYK
jgi:Family of unknown function (DUF5761)